MMPGRHERIDEPFVVRAECELQRIDVAVPVCFGARPAIVELTMRFFMTHASANALTSCAAARGHLLRDVQRFGAPFRLLDATVTAARA